MHDGGTGSQRLFRIEHRRQRLKIELNELRGILGRWFSEGHPFVFVVEKGRLQARSDEPAAAGFPPSVFEKISDDMYRTVSGQYRGEQLRVARAADRTVTKLNWATYLFTREPIAFGEHLDT